MSLRSLPDLPQNAAPTRPTPGQIMLQKGGLLVRVVSTGMRWVTVEDPDTGKNRHQVSIRDVSPAPATALVNQVKAKPVAASGPRPDMTELDREFMGDGYGKS